MSYPSLECSSVAASVLQPRHRCSFPQSRSRRTRACYLILFRTNVTFISRRCRRGDRDLTHILLVHRATSRRPALAPRFACGRLFEFISIAIQLKNVRRQYLFV